MTTQHPGGQIPTGNPFAPQPGTPGTPGGPGDPAPAGAYPSYHPAPPPPCQFCGALPAAHMTFRTHQGLLLMMRFQKIQGLMCRPCGEAVYRTTQNSTLWQGWWSPFSLFLFTPFTLVWNLFTRRKAGQLAPPPLGHPSLDVGKPVHRRALSYVALLPVGWILYLVTTISSGR